MRRLPQLLALALWWSSTPSIAQSNEDHKRAAIQLELWSEIKRELLGPMSPKYWEAMEGATIPVGMGSGMDRLRGTVVSSKPTDHPNQVVLAMSDDHTPELTLELYDEQDKPIGLTKPLEPGMAVEFGGNAKDFSREPFMLTIKVGLIVDRYQGLFIWDNATQKFQRMLE